MGIYQFVVVIAVVDSVDNRRPGFSGGVAPVGSRCGQPEITRGGFVDGPWTPPEHPQDGAVIPRLSHTGVRSLNVTCAQVE